MNIRKSCNFEHIPLHIKHYKAHIINMMSFFCNSYIYIYAYSNLWICVVNDLLLSTNRIMESCIFDRHPSSATRFFWYKQIGKWPKSVLFLNQNHMFFSAHISLMSTACISMYFPFWWCL